MSIKSNSYTTLSLIAATFTLGLTNAQADLLLVVSSSQEMFGPPSTSQVFERFGAQLVSTSLKGNYRKVYTWSEIGAPQSLDKTWQEILNESRAHANEPIDIFAMEHGPNDVPLVQIRELETLFDKLPVGQTSSSLNQKLLSIIPENSIRRFYSTACAQWGEFSTSLDGRTFKSNQTHISENLRTLGVKEYLIHANDNSTGLFTLPYLLSAFRKGESWITGGKKAMDRFDSAMSEQIKNIRRAWSQKLIRENLGGLLGSWTDILISRPVIGGTELEKHTNIFDNAALYFSDQREKMLAPSVEMFKVLNASCPTIFETDGSKECDMPENSASIGVAVNTLANIVHELFVEYAANRNGCVDVTAFQELLKLLKTSTGESPTFTSLCFVKNSNREFELKWSLAPTPAGRGREEMGKKSKDILHPDFWIVKPSQEIGTVDESPISRIGMARKGSLKLTTQGDNITLKIRGLFVGISDSEDVPGAAKPLIRRIRIRSLSLLNDGNFVAKLATTSLRLPFRVDGNTDEQSVSSFRIFGIKFNL